MLHEIRKDIPTKLWCGMGALCTVTGIPASEAKETFKDLRRTPDSTRSPIIKGISNHEMRQAYNQHGYYMKYLSEYDNLPMQSRPTLTQMLKKLDRSGDRIYLLHLTGHYVVVCGDQFNDNHTKTPVHVKKSPWRRKRVARVFEIGVRS